MGIYSWVPAAPLDGLLRDYLHFLDAPGKQKTVSIVIFITQLATDIHRTLRKLEGLEGMNRSQLLEIAEKIFNNRDPDEKENKRLSRILLVFQRRAK